MRFIKNFLGSISLQGVCNVHRAIAEVVKKILYYCRALVEVSRIPRDALFEIEAIASVTTT